MKKINFINNQQPAINDTNLNKLQDNAEDAIQEVQDVADDLDTNKLDKTSVKDAYNTSATDTYSCNYINGLETYSTDETRVGTWIDGRPIYRKVIKYHNNSTIGATGTTTNIAIAHNISNFDMLIKPALLIHKGYSTMMGGGSSVTSMVAITYIGTENVTMTIVNDTWSSADWYITLEYTKTTDV